MLIQQLSKNAVGIDFIRQIKFQKNSYDTLFQEPTNFIEQINQTSTYLVCLAAVELLLLRYPEHSFNVNFGVKAGYDVISEDNTIICECFAVTAPDSNGKLKKDVEKVYNNQVAKSKYVVFYASIQKTPYIEKIKSKYLGVEIIALDNIC